MRIILTNMADAKKFYLICQKYYSDLELFIRINDGTKDEYSADDYEPINGWVLSDYIKYIGQPLLLLALFEGADETGEELSEMFENELVRNFIME